MAVNKNGENQPTVKIEAAPKVNDQFGTHYLLSNKPQGSKGLLIGGAILGSLVLSSLLSGGSKERSRKAVGLKTPIVRSSGPVVIPKYSLTDELSRPEPRRKRPPRKPRSYSGPHVVGRPFSDQILPGSLVSAKLVSGGSDGLVKAVATESLEFLGTEVIPEGSVFVGLGKTKKHRLYVNFRSVVFPDGSVQKIQAIAADSKDKIAGLRGSKVGHYGLKLAAGAGLNLVSGLTQGMRERETVGGVAVEKSDLRNAALHGVSQSSLELSKEVLSKMKSDQPVIEIKANTPIYILFSGK